MKKKSTQSKEKISYIESCGKNKLQDGFLEISSYLQKRGMNEVVKELEKLHPDWPTLEKLLEKIRYSRTSHAVIKSARHLFHICTYEEFLEYIATLELSSWQLMKISDYLAVKEIRNFVIDEDLFNCALKKQNIISPYEIWELAKKLNKQSNSLFIKLLKRELYYGNGDRTFLNQALIDGRDFLNERSAIGVVEGYSESLPEWLWDKISVGKLNLLLTHPVSRVRGAAKDYLKTKKISQIKERLKNIQDAELRRDIESIL